jgi:hypothetical protein
MACSCERDNGRTTSTKDIEFNQLSDLELLNKDNPPLGKLILFSAEQMTGTLVFICRKPHQFLRKETCIEMEE